MFLYMKTNILRGLGIFKIDFPVVTNQLRVTLRLCPSTSPPLPQLLLHAPLWSRFFADIIGGLGLSKVADPIKEFGK